MHRLSLLILFLFAAQIAAQSPHGSTFKIDCADCHDAVSWNLLKQEIHFDHNKTNFQLIGQHKSIDCKMCHTTLIFNEVKQQCFNCHNDIHKNSVSLDCEKCHTPTSWLIPDIGQLHRISKFPLLGAHQFQDCNQCHTKYSELYFESLSVNCIDCHVNDYLSTQNPNHSEAGFSRECQDCHSVSNTQWTEGETAHTFFPLSGGHNIPNCFECHSQNTFEGLTIECYSCHQTSYDQTVNPNHTNLGFSKVCTDCHNINAWKPASFNHDNTGFILTGKHITTNCSSCHISGYDNTPTVCYSCHSDNYNSTSNPNHTAANFPNTCADCHSTNGWTPATFDHDSRFFPIYSGEHNGKWDNCIDCHTNQNNYSDFTCTNCHEHNQTDMNDEHQGINGYAYISSTCYSCHPLGKTDGAFNHSVTQFPLVGSHTSVSCQDCHQSGYSNTPTECYSCHQSNFVNSVIPNHTTVGISTECESCHNTQDWVPSSFNHSNTAFVLTGSHLNTTCQSCHQGQTSGTSQVCYSCHQSNFVNSVIPNHTTVGISTECESCHNTQDWVPSSFNHSNTAFVLTGSHLNTNCQSCHQGQTTGISQLCYSCHSNDYNNTTDPNHITSGYPTTCEQCHTTTAWSPATFDHNLTAFPLTGQHTSVNCSQCHSSGYTGTPTDCYSCHQSNFVNSVNPSHSGVGLPTECQSCHNTQAWVPSSFDHNNTLFILTGQHLNTTCQSCHQGQTTGISQLCYSCHQSNFVNSVNPNHSTIGISTECQSCHNTQDWVPSSFNHSNTAFVLTGQHLNTDCKSCHQGQTTGISQLCFSCHSNDFNNTTDPNHSASNFPTICQDCHTTNNWTPSTFNHDANYFPIYTGKHKNEWDQCSDCHTNQSNYNIFSCINCHEHSNQSEVNNDHDEVANYIYQSSACYDCHPRGDD